VLQPLASALADILAEAGATVVIVDSEAEKADSEARRLAEKHGGTVVSRVVDITNEEAVAGLAGDVSADLGAPAIRIFAGTAPRGVDETQARKWAVECIESCCDAASKRGVFLAVENHGGVVAKAEGLLEIVKAVGCPWVGINLDTGNFHSADPYEELARCAPYAVTCQLKTQVSTGGKSEDVDIPRIAALLRKANYRGYVTLEYEDREDPMTAVPRWLEKMRAALA